MKRALTVSAFLVAAFAGVAGAWHSCAGFVGRPELRPGLEAGYSVLRAVMVVGFALAVIKRPPARRPSRDPVAWIACLVAMGSVLLLEPPARASSTTLLLVGEVAALAAGIWIVASVAALGTCFGVLPEVRGLVTRGPYRLVRHPLYLGEMTAYAGLALAVPKPLSLVGALALLAAQNVRMRKEERALAADFPEYGEYAARTARVLPRICAPAPRLAEGRA